MPYRTVIDDLAAESFDIDLAQLPGVAGAANPPMLNTLEAIAAINFLLTRAMVTFRDPTRIQLATTHLTEILVDDLAENYSPAEMEGLVIPLLERRHGEYATLLADGGDAGQLTVTCGRAMLANAYDIDFPEPAATVSAALLFKLFTIEPARKLRDLNEGDRIDWGP